LVQPKSIRQKADAFIRWRKAHGFPLALRKRVFWGKKAWRRKQPS
jgi:hypothetical protein